MKTDLSGFVARRLAALVAVLLLCLAANSWADVLYVDAGATGANDGVTWASAYADLQAALAAVR